MKSQFPIKEGNLEIIENRIEIRDQWKSARFLYLFGPLLTIPYPLVLVLTHTWQDGLWWLGLALLGIEAIVTLFVFGGRKRRIFDSQIELDKIDKVILEKSFYDKLSAKFIFKNKRRRFVQLDFDRFWKADFEQALEAKGVIVESI